MLKVSKGLWCLCCVAVWMIFHAVDSHLPLNTNYCRCAIDLHRNALGGIPPRRFPSCTLFFAFKCIPQDHFKLISPSRIPVAVRSSLYNACSAHCRLTVSDGLTDRCCSAGAFYRCLFCTQSVATVEGRYLALASRNKGERKG